MPSILQKIEFLMLCGRWQARGNTIQHGGTSLQRTAVQHCAALSLDDQTSACNITSDDNVGVLSVGLYGALYALTAA